MEYELDLVEGAKPEKARVGVRKRNPTCEAVGAGCRGAAATLVSLTWPLREGSQL